MAETEIFPKNKKYLFSNHDTLLFVYNHEERLDVTDRKLQIKICDNSFKKII